VAGDAASRYKPCVGPEIPFFRLPLLPVAGVLGALIGSFLNVVIARLPEGENIAYPGSRCPHCHDAIPPWLNIPILSWIVLRGRCRACRAPISVRYPVVEALTATLFVACAARFGLTWATPVAWMLAGSLVVITFVDIDYWEIPDEISLPGIPLGAALRPLVFGAPWWSGLVGAALGAGALALIRGFYLKFRGVEGMGLGDVKLLGMIGAFLGVGGLLPTILVASISGTLIGGLLLLLTGGSGGGEDDTSAPNRSLDPVDEDSGAIASSAAPAAEASADEEAEEDWTPPANAVPFGPFLALGALTQLLLGDVIAEMLARVGLG